MLSNRLLKYICRSIDRIKDAERAAGAREFKILNNLKKPRIGKCKKYFVKK